ncbi:hypothetical protein LF63_0107875 [Oleiagrimonas soli]|nr:hypothetical protein LF63_0107875 [Oleiagrimonas soli]
MSMARHLMTVILLVSMAASVQAASAFRLQVDAGDGHGHVRKVFVYPDCGGDNRSPRIHWSHAPAGTRSFALTVFDPDANHGAGWWHWVVIDLPAGTHTLAENAPLPTPARSLRNDFGQRGWGGPCPPAGDPPHHYVFTLYALDVARLALPADASPASAMASVRAHERAQARTTFVYGR